MATPLPQSIAPNIQGDPTIALIAQLNRFRTAKQYNDPPRPELPLVATPITNDIAIETILLLQGRAMGAIQDPSAADALNELTIALDHPIQYVAPRVSALAQTLSLFGDSMGIAPAKVGITTRNAAFSPKWDVWMYASVAGALGIAAIFMSWAASRAARRKTSPLPV